MIFHTYTHYANRDTFTNSDNLQVKLMQNELHTKSIIMKMLGGKWAAIKKIELEFTVTHFIP